MVHWSLSTLYMAARSAAPSVAVWFPRSCGFGARRVSMRSSICLPPPGELLHKRDLARDSAIRRRSHVPYPESARLQKPRLW